jgi:methionyl-tRNA formyltransferase
MRPRVLFIGGRDLGARCLHRLTQADATVVCVIGRSDDTEAEGQLFGSVRNIARSLGIPYTDTDDLEDPRVAGLIESADPDIGFCVMYPRIVPGKLLGLVREGVFNLHGAPLPEYRGCLGHAWAIINGERTYGVSIHRMGHRLDDGPLVAALDFPVDEGETGTSLHQHAVEAAFTLFDTHVDAVLAGDFEETEQDASWARYYSKQPPYDRVVQWGWTALEILSYLRAMSFPGVPEPHTFHDGRRLLILSASLSAQTTETPGLPGTVWAVDDHGVRVTTGEGSVVVESVGIDEPVDGERQAISGRMIGATLPPGSRLGR